MLHIMESDPKKPKKRFDRKAGGEGQPHDYFRRFSQYTASCVGTSWSFLLALLVVAGWAVTGPLFGFSNTWQLVINTGTTIVTFLMVFLIQNTQNRDARAIHLKLDELLHGVKGARNRMVDLENCTDEELDEMEKEFQRLRKRSSARQRTGQK